MMQLLFSFLKRLYQCLLIISFTFLTLNAYASSFESSFRKGISDGALDRSEYVDLQELALEINDPEDYQFAQNLMLLLAQYPSFIKLNFGYIYQNISHKVSFFFSPHFAESDVIEGTSIVDVFAKISQQDILNETKADSVRCGASALLAAFYQLNGNLNQVFAKLKLPGKQFTYKHVHYAQEKLYQLANTDKKDGLTQKIVYEVDPNGRVKIIDHEGEIEIAAKRIGLKITPLKITEKVDLLDRQKVLLQLWQKFPKTPLLVGVHLDEHTGTLWPPNKTNHTENHFVTVFRLSNKVWLYNSGVSNNGTKEAMLNLTAEQIKKFVTQTSGSVNLVTKQ